MPRKMSKSDIKTLAEAERSIKNLTLTLNMGTNRYGEYGRNCRDAIARWQSTVARIHAAYTPAR